MGAISQQKHSAHLEYRRLWYRRNKERIRERQCEQNRESYQRHIEKRRAEGRERGRWLWKHRTEEMRAKMRVHSRKWRACHPEQRKQHSRKHSLKKLGLTPGKYEELLLAQSGCCAICGCRPKRTLAVDHDHKTGHVRGLLCWCCNSGLGQFKDQLKLLKKAADYLRQGPWTRP